MNYGQAQQLTRRLRTPAYGEEGRAKAIASPTPTIDAFYARLEPELSLEDLDTRAKNAAAILAKAITERDDDLAGKALTRLTERWQQREYLQPAPVWLWSRRAEDMAALFETIDDEHPLSEAVTHQMYYTIARASGEDREQAEMVAYRQTKQWFQEWKGMRQ